MTIAFNLSQLANYVDSSGKVDASAGLVNASPVANGGTGRASQTAYAVLCGGTTTTAAQQSIASVGTTGQVLTSNGAGALPTFQAATGSAIATMDVKTSGSSTAWTIPAGVTKVRITVVGGGGSGAVDGSGGGGGAGGGAAIKVLTGLTPGNTLTYTVGAGGTTSSTTGGTGGTSQVASGTQTITTISATGGYGGGAAPGYSPAIQGGGLGGIGSNGDLNIAGTCGDQSVSGANGGGGNSYMGGGGQGYGGTLPIPGRAYGAGGGAGDTTSRYGQGAAGVVIFEY